jgi:hypothetical protein
MCISPTRIIESLNMYSGGAIVPFTSLKYTLALIYDTVIKNNKNNNLKIILKVQ